MRRRTRAGRWIVAAVLGASCSRGPPTTYDINQPQQWDVGEVVTRTDLDEGSMAMLDENGNALAARGSGRSWRHESRIVQRCLETDGKKALLRSLVYVASWVFHENAVEDRSIEGAFVETSPVGWTLRSKDVHPSTAARDWLDTQFGPGSRPDAAVTAGFWAPHPLSVGEAWDAPSAEFVRQALGAPDRAPSSDDSRFHFLLVDVASTPFGEAVHVTETLDAPFVSGQSDAASDGVRYVAGTRMTMQGDCKFVPGRSQRSSVKTFGGETTFVSMRDGLEVRALSKIKTNSTSTAGGEMPEPPPK